MGHTAATPFNIRPLRRMDRQPVRDICVATNWMGKHRPDLLIDEWLWAEYWTRYFTDRQPTLSWVAERTPHGAVVGYLTGTDDVREFYDYLPRLIGGMICRLIWPLITRPLSRKLLRGFGRSSAAHEFDLPPALLADYPGTWHFNLIPEARRQGLGTRMLTAFMDALKSRRVTGVHGQVLSLNHASIAACRRMGMTLLHSGPMTAFASVIDEPIELQTWGMRLSLPGEQISGALRDEALEDEHGHARRDRPAG